VAAPRVADAADAAGATRGVAIERLDPAGYEAAIPAFGDLLVDAVEHGAGVNFLAPLDPVLARAWWAERAGLVASGVITAIVARDGRAAGPIVGCVILIRAQQQNGPHRADVSKLLVHSGVRRRGIARALMAELETVAREDGRWLLVLDSETGTGAEATYRALGWTAIGEIPAYALRTNGEPGPATFFYKDLR
jgi:ribosomal protein S18 acetylase RimI-like enzyme